MINKPVIGEKYLVTTDQWFFAPDGAQYRAVFGTVRGILKDDETLGIKTNAKSTNWYLSIGNMLVAGCQIHYAVKTDKFVKRPFHVQKPEKPWKHKVETVKGEPLKYTIYNADEDTEA